MQTTTIDQLSPIESLNGNEVFPISQDRLTRCTTLGEIKEYINEDLNLALETEISNREQGDTNLSNTIQQVVETQNQARESAISGVMELLNEEIEDRKQGDIDTLQEAKDYTDQEIANTVTAANHWLSPVKTTEDLPITGLLNDRDYLCKVTADPIQSGVYQCVEGWTDTPVWTLYDDNVDFVIEEELQEAVDDHNVDPLAHEDIRTNIINSISDHDTDEDSHTDIRELISDEESARVEEDESLQHQIDDLRAGGSLTPDDIEAAIEEHNGDELAHEGILTPINHAAPDTTTDPYPYGKAEGVNYGHMRFPPEGANTAAVPKSAFPYEYIQASTVFNLNTDIKFKAVGIYVLYNPASGSVGFPDGWGTGSANTAILIVLPFYSNTAVKQIIYKRGTNIKYERYSTAINTWGISEFTDSNGWRTDHPTGCIRVQYPGERSPVEQGLPGTWEDCTSHVAVYAVYNGTLTSSTHLTAYASGSTIAANAYRVITDDDGDKWIGRARRAISGAPSKYDPIDWIRPGESGYVLSVTFVPRQSIHPNSWTTNITTIDNTALADTASGSYNNYRVVGFFRYSGKFFAAAGGNRPTYNSAPAPDMQRAVTAAGQWALMGYDHTDIEATLQGAFYKGSTLNNWPSHSSGSENYNQWSLRFDSGRVVPIGAENAVRHFSIRLWRKT